MPPSPRRGARTRVLALLPSMVVVAAMLGAVPPAGATHDGARSGRGVPEVSAPSFEAGRYVVLLKDPGATGYAGGERGLAATRVTGERGFDARSSKVRSYESHLRGQHDRLAASVGADALRHYTLTANGFSAHLTGRQALKLAGHRDVLLVAPDERQHLDTWNTPDTLGLTGDRGAWQQHARGASRAGSGVVVGVLDSGIWPESASFRGARLTTTPRSKWDIARRGETVTMDKADGGTFRGRCQLSHRSGGATLPAQDWAVSDCTTKLVGARYYPEEFLDEIAPEHRSPVEVLSTRDGNGHGTHTAGTAVGVAVDGVEVEGVRFGQVSGMAPGAKVAAYKVCFDDDDLDTGDCFNGAILAAIEDAVADGVDVINFSISGATDSVLDLTEIAFEGAAEAGVFVAASAGNSGPGESTVSHNSPWVTTVAATTHHTFENTVALGDGQRIRGASVSRQSLPSTSLVGSVSAAAPGAAVEDARLCLPGTLDPAKTEGRIVVCTRGVNARVEKSAVVDQAGGVGMVLANVAPGSLDADFHSVPTVHVSHQDALKVFAYLDQQAGAATASLEQGDTTGLAPTPVPQVAAFSSRGPAIAAGGDLLKPDLAAPGVSVLAAVAPPANEDRAFDLYSGTSMASPHVAGLAAFMLAERPRWTPMKVKSAMMTTARSVRTAAGGTDRDPHGQGAGEVRPRRFLDPGLFVTSGATDWRRFLRGQGLDIDYRPLAAKNLNSPSLAQGQVTSETSFTRVFTAARAGTWKVSVQVPGFAVRAPGKLVARRAGDRRSLTVHFSRTDAPLGEFSTGHLLLQGPTTVRLPIALRPVSVLAPKELSGTGVEGTVGVPVTGGMTGALDVVVTGPVESDAVTGTARAISTGYEDEKYYCFEVTEGSRAARFDVDAADDTGDMDLMVIPVVDHTCAEQADTELYSATESADERVTILDPEPGWYVAAVDPFAAPPGSDRLDWRLDFFDASPTLQAGTLVAAPDPVPLVDKQQTSFDATWSGLRPNTRYLGLFEYENALTPTFLTIDTGP